MKQGAIKSITCQTCTEKGQKAQYRDETARTCFDRVAKQLVRLEKRAENSVFWTHHRDIHGAETGQNFRMKVENLQTGT